MATQGCDALGCERPHYAKGACSLHYRRRAEGRADETPYRKQDDTFASFVTIDDDGCHVWTGSINNMGYGLYRDEYAHRVAVRRDGRDPTGMQVDHLCRNRRCVNPSHLDVVDGRTNMLRGFSPGALAVRTNICIRGHEFTPENTYYRPDGAGRQCRRCHNIREREYASRR